MKFLLKYLFFLFLLFNTLDILAQVKISKNSNTSIKSTITTSFTNDDLLFKKGEIISNVLKVKNNTSTPVKFYVDLSVPDDWKTFNKNTKLYSLASNDSIFIPLRIIPMELSKGSTKFMISALISSYEGEQLGYSFFLAHTFKDIKWTMDVIPDVHLYFKNNSNLINFSIYLENTGNDKQDIQLSLLNKSKYYLITDTAGKALTKLSSTLSLEAGSDTTMNYIVKNFAQDRNLKMIDFETYNPFLSEEVRKYTMYVNSCVPGKTENSRFRVYRKLDFYKLPNYEKVNPYSSNVIPIIMDMNVYNLVSGNPVTNLMLRGTTQLNDNASLSYSTQTTFSPDYVKFSDFNNTPFYLGYFHKNYNIEIGDIGFLGAKGIRSMLNLKHHQKIELHYSASPVFSTSPDRANAGLRYNWQIKKIGTVNFLYDYITYNQQNNFKSNSNNAQINFSFHLLKKHSFTLSAGESRNYFLSNNASTINYGYLWGVGYGSHFFKKHLYTNANVQYTSNNYQNYSFTYLHNNEKIKAYLNNRVMLSKNTAIDLSNNYFKYATNTIINGSNNYYNSNFLNQLSISNKNNSGFNFSYFGFYNILQADTFKSNSRGIGFNTSKYDIENNKRNSINLRTGYIKALDYVDTKNYFFIQFSALSQYRTLNFQLMYNYGNPYVTRYFVSGYQNQHYQQYLKLSSRYQYIFKNPRFVALPFFSYAYSNLTGSKVNLNPELDYFTRTGWRFKIIGNYYFAVSKKHNYFYNYNYVSEENPTNNVYSNFNLSVGIHKNFGIPLPSRNPLYNTTKFIVFIDVNGNNKMDKEESPLENVVIAVDGKQVITNSKGEAILENMKVGTYVFKVLSLEDLNGWFPKKEDSLMMVKKYNIMYIPFSRGVKIFGNVSVERDPNSPAAKSPLDLSRIKISASDGKVYNTLTDEKGFYELFLPFGSYVLTMDENILGEKFKLLQNNYQLQINDSLNNLFIPFHIIEKKRKLIIKHTTELNYNPNDTITTKPYNNINITTNTNTTNNNTNTNANTNVNNTNNTTTVNDTKQNQKELLDYLENLKKIKAIATTISDKCKQIAQAKEVEAANIAKKAEAITNQKTKQKELAKVKTLRSDIILLNKKSESAKTIATDIQKELDKQNIKVNNNYIKENTNKLIYLLLNENNTNNKFNLEDIKSVLDENKDVILPDDTTVKKKAIKNNIKNTNNNKINEQQNNNIINKVKVNSSDSINNLIFNNYIDKEKLDNSNIEKTKAFIKNSVKPSETKGLFFTVQIGAYKKLDIAKFDKVNNVLLEVIENKIRVCSGKFDNFLEVDALKNSLNSLGFTDAYVVAYYNGKKITMKEAKSIYYNRFSK